MFYKYDKDALNYKRIKSVYIIMLGLLVVFLCWGCIFFIMNRNINSIKYISEETKTLILNEKDEFTSDKLKQFILELNIKFPHIVYAQAKLESRNFKSRIFRENHNLFGMKVARKRPTTNKGEQYNHAYFDSWKDCVVDYAFYQAAYLSDLKTEHEYLEYLKLNYAEDGKYIQKVKQLSRLPW